MFKVFKILFKFFFIILFIPLKLSSRSCNISSNINIFSGISSNSFNFLFISGKSWINIYKLSNLLYSLPIEISLSKSFLSFFKFLIFNKYSKIFGLPYFIMSSKLIDLLSTFWNSLIDTFINAKIVLIFLDKGWREILTLSNLVLFNSLSNCTSNFFFLWINILQNNSEISLIKSSDGLSINLNIYFNNCLSSFKTQKSKMFLFSKIFGFLLKILIPKSAVFFSQSTSPYLPKYGPIQNSFKDVISESNFKSSIFLFLQEISIKLYISSSFNFLSFFFNFSINIFELL